MGRLRMFADVLSEESLTENPGYERDRPEIAQGRMARLDETT
jgi:hypothetical protein